MRKVSSDDDDEGGGDDDEGVVSSGDGGVLVQSVPQWRRRLQNPTRRLSGSGREQVG